MSIDSGSVTVFDFAMAFFLAVAFFFAARNFRMLSSAAALVAPFTVMGIILVLSVPAAYTISGVSLEANLTIIRINGFQLLRNSFMAIVGTVLLKVDGFSGLVHNCESGFGFLNQMPRFLIPLIIIGHIVYTCALYYSWGNWGQLVSPCGFSSYLPGVLLGALAAVSEELAYRLFLIALIVHLLRKHKTRWTIAIVGSALYWALLHFDVANLGLIKVVQVLPLGLVLGFMMLRYGFWSAVFTHLTTNMIAITFFCLLGFIR